MSKTKIEYGDRTWNVLTGCTIKSEGCVNCWARGMAKRLKAMGRPEYEDAVDDAGNWTGKITLVPERLNEPLTWRKPQHVLVENMGDLFHKNVPMDYIDRVFDVMRQTPQHTYQTLTKRPNKMATILQDYEPLPNVILGTSVENQKRADERVQPMHFLSVRGWRTWVSYEPALEAVGWYGWEFLDQLICGGESGHGARVMNPNSARSARDFCVRNGIPFFFKQWGEFAPLPAFHAKVTENTTFKSKPIDVDGTFMFKVGKGMAGHVLDGQEWREMPRGKVLTK
jgi:protein gp37